MKETISKSVIKRLAIQKPEKIKCSCGNYSKIISDGVPYCWDCHEVKMKKTFIFKNMAKKDAENLQKIFVECDYMYNEIRSLRKENAELKEFIRCDI